MSNFRRLIDDFLAILEQHTQRPAFAIGDRPTVADFSMIAYPSYPNGETGYDFAASHPAANAWLGRLASLRGFVCHGGADASIPSQTNIHRGPPDREQR
jgi:glutathione S-transferase